MKSYIFILPLLVCSLISCKKYLDIKRNKTQTSPQKLQDIQALLDNYDLMNGRTSSLSIIVADEHYLPSSTWSSRSVNDRNNYIWDKDAIDNLAWRDPYQPIYYANVVLNELPKIDLNDNNSIIADNIKGQALFFRSFYFFNIAQLYCKPYTSSADSDMGIPIRLNPGIEEPSTRSSVQQTYDQIINDIKEAVDLLPELSSGFTRPNKAAAFGLLSRVYLSMRDYANAGKYSDSCLKRFDSLIDYNTLDPNAFSPIADVNPETIFYAFINNYGFFDPSTLIDTLLYQSYDDDDLRKSVLFEATGSDHYFKGSYAGVGYIYPFAGIATDEMFLIRAECAARANLIDSAMNDLNRLRIKRWKNTVPYPSVTATSVTDALNKVLIERKKELVFRGTRWSDLRRLNIEDSNISLNRFIDGTTYTLPPNDARWVMLIPLDIIGFTGIPQNPR